MWRRLVSSNLKTLPFSPSSRSIPKPSFLSPLPTPSSSHPSSSLLSRHFATASETVVSKRLEDVMPIATGHEREELQAELQGTDILEINYPVGPFGTKESPAIVKSYYDRRIVGCPGGDGEDEHDVVWFWLEKDRPFECPVCTQYFKLEVVGPGGDPEGHDDEDRRH